MNPSVKNQRFLPAPFGKGAFGVQRRSPPGHCGGASAAPRRGDSAGKACGTSYLFPLHYSLKTFPFPHGFVLWWSANCESLSHGYAVPAPFHKGAFGCTADTGRVREVTIRRKPPWALSAATRRSSRPSGAMGAVQKKCPLQRGLQRAGFYLESRSLSSASSEPLARLKRPRSSSTVSLFFSSPATSTRILPSYIIIRRLP